MAEQQDKVDIVSTHAVEIEGSLSYRDLCLELSHNPRLQRHARKRTGKLYRDSILVTTNGLEHPVLLDINGLQLPFERGLVFASLDEPLEHGGRTYSIRAQELRGGGQPAEHLQKRRYQLWALDPYPNLENPYRYSADPSSRLFDPFPSTEDIKDDVKKIYSELTEYSDGKIDEGKPLVFYWETRTGRYRLAIRPYKSSDPNGQSFPSFSKHELTIATTIKPTLI